MSDNEIRTDGRELTVSEIQARIIRLPGRPPVMLDRDLAEIYGVETKKLNQAVKRNPRRFPDDFCFRLTKDEVNFVRSQNETFQWLQDVRYLPWAYSREGANMFSAVLHTDFAVDRSVWIMRAFSATEQEILYQGIVPEDTDPFRQLFAEAIEQVFTQTIQEKIAETVCQAVTDTLQKTLSEFQQALTETVRETLIETVPRFAEAAEVKPAPQSQSRQTENPVASFVTTLCIAEPDARIPKDELYGAYTEFCDEKDIYPLTKNVFFKNLYAHAGHVRPVTITVKGGRIPAVRGIDLKTPIVLSK